MYRTSQQKYRILYRQNVPAIKERIAPRARRLPAAVMATPSSSPNTRSSARRSSRKAETAAKAAAAKAHPFKAYKPKPLKDLRFMSAAARKRAVRAMGAYDSD